MIQCDICREVLVEQICAISCGHLFHRVCIDNLKGVKDNEDDEAKCCPTCCKVFYTSSILDVHPSINVAGDINNELCIMKETLSELGFNIQLIEQRINEWKETELFKDKCNSNRGMYSSQNIAKYLAYPVNHDSDSLEKFKSTLSDDFLTQYTDDDSKSYYTSPNYNPEISIYSGCGSECCSMSSKSSENSNHSPKYSPLVYAALLPRHISSDSFSEEDSESNQSSTMSESTDEMNSNEEKTEEY